MAKAKTANAYQLELKRMIKERTGAEMQPWLLPQVRSTAAMMVVLDKIQDEIMAKDSLVTVTIGSTGQQKTEVNPLVAYYDKMQRTLMLQFEALSLNYKVMPSKVNEPTKPGGDEQDKLVGLLGDLTNV